MPLISVLMPAYNAERYVGEAVESILGQSLGDLELIVIDDGSSDGTRAALEALASRDGRVRLVSRGNLGIRATRNEALALASGEFVAIMDADDVALPNRLEAQVSHLRGDPGCVGVGSWAQAIDEDGEALGIWRYPTSHEEIDGLHLAGDQVIPHPTFTARRAAVVGVGGYTRDLCEDLDLYLRLAESGRLANLPEVLLKVRRHNVSVTHRGPGPVSEANAAVVSDARRRRGLPDLAVSSAVLSVGRSLPASNHRAWAWSALGSGNVATARKHAWSALRADPLSALRPSSWRLAYCVLRGR